jgi:hypothetical protein
MSTWNKEEWKKRSKAFVEGKTCEWCGAENGDTYTDRKGKTRNKHLTPHHRDPPKLGLRAYKKIATKFYREHKDEHSQLRAQAIEGLGDRVEEKDLRKRVRFLFDEAHREEIDELYQEYKRRVEEEYMDLTPEKIMVLCNRCHTARKYGKVLCRKCRENYHNPKYPTCYTCAKGS